MTGRPMVTGPADELRSMEHQCTILNAAAPAKKRGPYKTKAA
jgi:hypothetical protein